MTTEQPLRGRALARATIDYIHAHPEEWYQGLFHSFRSSVEGIFHSQGNPRVLSCGTAHCFAGTAALLACPKEVANHAHSGDLATELLDIDYDTSVYLFDPSRTLADLERFVAAYEASPESTGQFHFVTEN